MVVHLAKNGRTPSGAQFLAVYQLDPYGLGSNQPTSRRAPLITSRGTIGMAAGAQSLRLCLQSYRQAPAFRALRPNTPQLRRALSTTTIARRREANDKDAVDLGFDRVYNNPGDVVDDLLRTELLSAKDRNQLAKAQSVWSELPHEQKQALQKDVQEVRQAMGPLRRIRKAKRSSFWGEEETDSDLITDELGEDDFEEDDILSMGHGKLEEHRELREYARIAIWEMPLLSSKFPGWSPRGCFSAR